MKYQIFNILNMYHKNFCGYNFVLINTKIYFDII